MALQRVGDAGMPGLWQLVERWMTHEHDSGSESGSDDSPLLYRAVMAGICEPRLLTAADNARRALEVLDRITEEFTDLDPTDRRGDAARALRQALGYGWSVATAASPADGFSRMERLAHSADPDIRWIVKENLKKARLAKADPVAAAHLATSATGPATGPATV